jgi:predicted dehydrogenase
LPDQFSSATAILLFGSGRWAKILLTAILETTEHTVPVIIVTQRNRSGIRQWLLDQRLTGRINVVKDPSEWNGPVRAAIVVNAASDHYAAATWCIKNKIPVLVEKPVCTHYPYVQQLYAMALEQQVMLCPAHIFLFAGYLYEFRNVLPTKANRIHINWTDPAFEQRYGEIKNYDPSLPVYADWVPHLISLLVVVLSSVDVVQLKSVYVSRGGALLRISLVINTVICEILMERNCGIRRRQVQVFGISGEMYELDFSSEPGTINLNGTSQTADKLWKDRPRPTVQMIRAFLDQVDTGVIDHRLDMLPALTASKLSAEIEEEYIRQRNTWLSQVLTSSKEFSDDMRYACSEIISGERHWELKDTLEKLVNGFYRYTWGKAPVTEEIFSFLTDSNSI